MDDNINYKKSGFVVEKKTETDLYLLNTLYGSFWRVSGKIMEEVWRCFQSCGMENAKWIQFLTENHYLHNMKDEDEIEQCKKMAEKVVDESILNLIILPTEKCNFMCNYCYEGHQGINMSQNNIEKLVDFTERMLVGKKGLNVSWFGGEPLLQFEVIKTLSEKFINLCKEKRLPYTASITTNGFYLNVNRFEELKRLHVYSFQITIDGFAETHNKQRYLNGGKGSWKVIVENILEIKEKVKSNLVTFMIRVNINKAVYENYREFVDFLHDEFSNDKRFKFLFRPVYDWGNIEAAVKENFISEKEYLDVITYSLEKGLYNEAVKMAITPGGNLCYAWKRNSYVIRSSGELVKCTVYLERENSKIGNLDSEKIYLDKWKFEFDKIAQKCKKCCKMPICLKMFCETEESLECDEVTENLENIIELIAQGKYGCKEIS